MLRSKSKGLRLSRRLFFLWRWRRRPTTYRRLQPDRPLPATKLLRWVFSLKQRFYSPMLGRGKEDNPSQPAPKGHLVVYVGGSGDKEVGPPPQRYLVPVIYCNHPLFGELLREAEEEFGFQHPGGLTIPCPASRFERVRNRIAGGGAVDCRRSGRRSLWAL